MRSRPRPVAFAAVGLLVLLYTVIAFLAQPSDFHTSDFCSFWAGAQLIGPDLYNPSAAAVIQRRISPEVSSKRYIRPPFYALMLWPLGKLSFRHAYAAWILLNLFALLLFLRLWRSDPVSCLACAVFWPVAWNFGIGQDGPLLLLVVAVGARFLNRKQDGAAGGVLALCAIKPHLFPFVPLALFLHKRYTALLGMAVGVVLLCVAAVVAVGPMWPEVLMRAVTANEATIVPNVPGVAGLVSFAGAPVWLSVAVLPFGALIVYKFVRGTEMSAALAYAVAVGVVFAPRALIYDAALYLPLLLIRASPAAIAILGIAAATTVTPLAIVAQLTSAGMVWFVRPSRYPTEPIAGLQGTNSCLQTSESLSAHKYDQNNEVPRH